MATIKDVAKLAGVSKATVSRVLNNAPKVSDETKRKVRWAIEQLGFRPSIAARSLTTKRTMNLGIILARGLSGGRRGPDRPVGELDYFDYEVISGIESVTRDAGYNLSISTPDTVTPGARMPLFVENHQADGIFVVGGMFSEEFIRRLRIARVPIVIVGSYTDDDDITCVYPDYQRGARKATEHLLALGHRAILFINGPSLTRTSADKLLGYRTALANAGVTFSPDLVREGDFQARTGQAVMEEVLASPMRPTAVFAANDSMAIGAINALAQHGMGVPEDVAVVGFYDYMIASQTRPGLTTVRTFSYEMGRLAAARLLETVLCGGPQGVRITVPVELVIRESCGYDLGVKGERPSEQNNMSEASGS